MTAADIRSVRVLEDLRSDLARFRADADDALRAAAREIERVHDWLAEREQHWKRELRRREELLMSARAALAACLASGDRDHPPSCGAYQAAVFRAQRHVAEAQAELHKVKQWSAAIHDATATYQREAHRLGAALAGDVPKARASLDRKLASLYDYAATALPSSGIPTSAASLFSSSSPSSLSGTGRGAGSEAPLDTGVASAPAGDSWSPGSVGPSIHDVPLDQIDVSDSPVRTRADFLKISYDEMVEGFDKLESVVKLAVERGADGGFFDRLDAERGLDYPRSYRRVYDAFYGADAIRLERLSNRYQVVNGYHRLFVARDLGVVTVPAHVVGE